MIDFTKFYFEESVGITNRKPGDQFETPDGNTRFTFEKLYKRPEKGSMSVEEIESDVKSLVEEIAKEVKEKPTDINVIQTTKLSKRTQSYMLMFMKNDDDSAKRGEQYYAFVKYFTTPMTYSSSWTSGDFKDNSGMNLALVQRARMQGSLQRLLVSDFFTSDKLNSQDILEQSQKEYEKADEPVKKEILKALNEMLLDISGGGKNNYTLKGMGKHINLFDVSLCEVIAPFILMNYATGKNKTLVNQASISNLQECVEDTVLNFKRWTVSIPSLSNEKLIDSKMYDKSDKPLFSISNKSGKGGAPAATSNLYDSLQNVKTNNPSTYDEIIEAFPDEFSYLEILAKNNSKLGPLKLAVKLKIINGKDADSVMETIKTGEDSLTKNVREVMKNFNARAGHQGYYAGYHALASIAKQVGKQANAESQFSEFAKRVLINSSFVQAKMKFSKVGEDLVLKELYLQYPPIVKVILMHPGKNYTATKKPIGKMSFNVK